MSIKQTEEELLQAQVRDCINEIKSLKQFLNDKELLIEYHERNK